MTKRNSRQPFDPHMVKGSEFRKSKIKVTQDDEPVESKVLAHAIVDISKAAKKLADSGLNKKAIVLLVSAKSKCTKSDVTAVLDALEDLTRTYCR